MESQRVVKETLHEVVLKEMLQDMATAIYVSHVRDG